ncbi:MAG: diaminopimelate epimerase [Pseudomonadota bacterium]|jgi:diaminopimelate epimerase
MAMRFSKMHGIGNDFVVLDRREQPGLPAADLVRAMADRHTGVGFDQMMVLEPPRTPGSVGAYRILNADGSEARQCGNGLRCLVAWLHREDPLCGLVQLDGPAGPVVCEVLADGRIRAGMGVPGFAPAEVPFVADAEVDAYELDIDGSPVSIGIASIGNPHAVLEVDDTATAPVSRLGPAIERHPRFPQRANVGFAQVVGARAIRLRVFERGVGETLACGSGACAAAAVLLRRGRVASPVAVTLPGGTLEIDWAGGTAPLSMAGPAAFVFEGTWNP